MQIQPLDQLFIRHIRKSHIVDIHLSCHILKLRCVFRFGNLGFFLDQFKDPGRTGKGVLQLRDHAGNLIKRLGILVCIRKKTSKLPNRQPTPDHRKRTGKPYSHVHQTIDKPCAGIGQRRKENRPEGTFFQPSIDLIKPIQGFIFPVKGLNHLLVSYHLIDKSCLLPPGTGL